MKNFKYYNIEKTIGIDFDGPIHKNSKGYYDGSIYDEPADGIEKAFKWLLKQNFELIIYSTKTRPDREFPDGKTGADNIRLWLEKWDLLKYIKAIQCFKPLAKYYIDNNTIIFLNWKQTLKEIKKRESNK